MFSQGDSSDGVNDAMSIADMVRQAAEEVCHSRVPPGFDWIPEYEQYYSYSTGYFYNPSTCLFFHSESQTYYVFNEETNSYDPYAPPPPKVQQVLWRNRGRQKRGRALFGHEFISELEQDDVDICELLFSMVDLACKDIKDYVSHEDYVKLHSKKLKKLERKLAKNGNKNMIYTEDPSFVAFEQVPENDGESDGSSEFSYSGDPENSLILDDERIQMMHDEGFSQPPLLRIIDEHGSLHIITMTGGTIGSSIESDVCINDPYLPHYLLDVLYVAEESSYTIRLLDRVVVHLNDFTLQVGDSREVLHGDVIRIHNHQLMVHVHYGSNTCPGCEPGLLKSSAGMYTPKAVSGETARRRTLKMIKQSYGITHYEEPFRNHKRKGRGEIFPNVRDKCVRPADSNNMYANCKAQPIPGVTLPSTSKETKSIGVENKGFHLLKGMGWKEGEGLGKDNAGRVEPVISKLKADRTGLGTEQNKKPPATFKDALWDSARKRFDEIQTNERKK